MGNRKIGEKCNTFISWNHNDIDILNKLVDDKTLKNTNSEISVWHSEGTDAFGSLDEIKNQIELCDTFIVIISVNSIKSEWVYNEFMQAYNSKKISELNILPIIIDYEEINKIKDFEESYFKSNNPLWKIMSKF